MEQYIAYNLALGIVNTSPQCKQELGRAFAEVLGFKPGHLGSDGGIDGVLYREDGGLIHFQSKLSQSELDVERTKLLYADIMYHRAVCSIMLAGIGYKETFRQRLFKHPYLEQVSIHLLTLVDVLAKTDTYYLSVQKLPKLMLLEQIDWRQFR